MEVGHFPNRFYLSSLMKNGKGDQEITVNKSNEQGSTREVMECFSKNARNKVLRSEGEWGGSSVLTSEGSGRAVKRGVFSSHISCETLLTSQLSAVSLCFRQRSDV